MKLNVKQIWKALPKSITTFFISCALLITFVPLAAQTGATETTTTASAAYSCIRAPSSRLRVGMEAVVAPGLGPLNLRSLPAISTGIELQLYGGNRVQVLSGPSCNGNYHWWRVENINGIRGWIAEGDWERYYLLPASDADRVPPRIVSPLEWSCPPIRRVCLLP